MPYTFLTLGQTKAALAQRLYNATQTFFAPAELGSYIAEALSLFNAFANFYRQEFTFDVTQNVTWYDLTALPGTLRPLTVTDQSILELIEYHLLEPQTSAYPLVWAGSNQFQVTDILNAIQQVRDQLLSESNCTITQQLVSATPGRTFLGDTCIGIRRVSWIPTTGFGYAPNCLLPSDIWGEQSFEAGFPQTAPGYPLTYRRSTEPPLSFDVDVQPAVPGNYDVLTVNAGLALSTTAASIIPVPNDWCPIIKYGALAQLFGRDSASHDTLRAQYCLARYKQGVSAMGLAPALLAARINDVPVVVEALTSMDFYLANWQGTSGQPQYLGYSGQNMLAAIPVPDGNGPYSVTASVLSNMVLPANDGAYLQVGRDDISAILDEAQHIAMLKGGGSEFAETFPLHANFMRHCSLYNSKLKALSPFLEMIDLRSMEDQRENPVFQKDNPATVN
jgi:hypothetical protein